MNREIPEDYVRMQKCFQCGKDTGAILMSTRLKSIPEAEAYSDLCPECKELTKDMKHFVCRTCNKHGFIKKSALTELIKPEALAKFESATTIGFERCPKCLGMLEE